MAYGLTQTVAPNYATLVDFDRVKLYCRVDINRDDAILADMIVAAIQRGERVTDRQFGSATFVASYAGFPCYEIRLPKPPVQSIVSVKYYAHDGTDTTVAADKYRLIRDVEPALLVPELYTYWPINALIPNSLRVEFVAGYPAGALNAELETAVKRCVAHEYEFREKADDAYMDALFSRLWFGRVA